MVSSFGSLALPSVTVPSQESEMTFWLGSLGLSGERRQHDSRRGDNCRPHLRTPHRKFVAPLKPGTVVRVTSAAARADWGVLRDHPILGIKDIVALHERLHAIREPTIRRHVCVLRVIMQSSLFCSVAKL